MCNIFKKAKMVKKIKLQILNLTPSFSKFFAMLVFWKTCGEAVAVPIIPVEELK